jgi:hypothetical protein
MGGGGNGGATGGCGGIEGGGRIIRLGSRVPSQIATPMGTDKIRIHGKQHHNEKHGHSRLRPMLRSFSSTTSAFSYTNTLRVGLAASSSSAPVPMSE